MPIVVHNLTFMTSMDLSMGFLLRNYLEINLCTFLRLNFCNTIDSGLDYDVYLPEWKLPND